MGSFAQSGPPFPLGLGFHVSGFWAVVFGSLVVSIVSTVIWIFIRPEVTALRLRVPGGGHS